jgi:PAS domain S-box-containing protein
MSTLETKNRNLELSRDFAEGIIDTLRDPLVILDTKLNVVAANTAFYEKFCSTPDEVRGRKIYDLNNRSWDFPELRKLLEDTLRENTSFRDFVVDHQFPWLGHRTLLLNGRRVYEKGEETEKILLVIEDITLRRQQEKAMRFQADALNRVNDAVIAINKDGCLTYWNSRAETLLKIPTDASSWIKLEDICTRIESESSGLFAVSSPDQPWREYRIRLKDTDDEYYLESSATVSLEKDGSPAGRLVVLRDVTARTKAEILLKRTNSELELFTSIASHDLQEPLRTVTVYMQMLAKLCKGKLGESADEYIDFAVDGTKRMKALLDDLLLYARFQPGGENFRRVSLRSIVTNVVHDLEIAIKESHASVDVSALPEVIADEGQMRQVFQNLITNAIRHKSEDRTPVIKIAADKNATDWIISVKDNGVGFDMVHAERIFQLFQRLEARAATSGTGLGLTITKKIVEAHQGRIWVESLPGVGSTFYFTLPC